ncbi:MAG: exodeoxyribonuclease III [Treponema sp.]|jgi:exodeoxyribonuclease-3|nr:exodeoxyribonuclease III [Treponema sp.]
MRIVSWNVNGIRAVEKRGFADWLVKDHADIVCLNETKASPEQLSPELLNPVVKGTPYSAFWASSKKKGYAGVAVYSREKPRDVRFLGDAKFDDEGRVLAVEYRGFTLIAAYFPNSQDERKRLDYKLAFCDAMLEFCNTLIKKKRHYLLCGDYNIAHTPIDLAHPKANENNAGYLPEEREWMDKFIAAGNVDTFRHFHQGEGGHYTWWSYRSGAREKNVGWRIDYHCVDKGFMPMVRSSNIRSEVQGSDHCPVEIELDL